MQLCTEIKERQHWDISAPERLDIVKEFCNNGLEHWGSDAMGVEKTRRFFLEWQSFLCRYVRCCCVAWPEPLNPLWSFVVQFIRSRALFLDSYFHGNVSMYLQVPVGLLERVPMRIHEHVPLYTGRSDLETWLGSKNVRDWIKLSEMYVCMVRCNFHSYI